MNECKIKKAIITGGSGGPGQALVRKLISEGIEVLLLIRKSSGRAKYFPESNLISYSYCEMTQMKNYEPHFADYDVFFHLGWDYTDPIKRKKPYFQYKNIETTLDAVDLAYRAGCKVFVGCGSQAEYGNCEGILTPTTPCNPQIAYGMAKLCAGQMAKLVCHEKGMRFNWLRVMSVYGPVDNPYNVFSSTIIDLLNGRSPKYTAGEQIWDLLYTGDLADAFYAVARNGKPNSIYTVGSGKAQTLRSEIEEFAKQIDENATLQFGTIPYSNGQTMFLLADNTDITNDTGWVPSKINQVGVKETILFWKYLIQLYGDDLYVKYFEPGKRIDWDSNIIKDMEN